MSFDNEIAARTRAASGQHTLANLGATPLFVLLWSSGAIFARLGLDHATPFALLTLRFALAFGVLAAIGSPRRRWLPPRGARLRVAVTGLLLVGSYSVCYLLALAQGMTPGALATVLGAQPVLTLILIERTVSPARLAGLALSLTGLLIVVGESLAQAHFSAAGVLFALASLLSMTLGAIMQKGIALAPAEVLPLQYGASLVLCLLIAPFQPFAFDLSIAFAIALLWLALVISVGATLLYYRLIRRGNLVNVTSLFYLVPAGTAVLDYLLLSNRLAPLSLAGMGAILCGVALVFRRR